ncbi:tyrosine-type recombinase/integrase [Savagea faecisuis]|uniref:Tyrosine-type recombinase/integrase n=1 Tax=Savagea faecisuis TaxID=1274803 RepID=A0ABW3GVQ9_9BACL
MKVLCYREAMEMFDEWLRLRQLSMETVRGYGIDVRQFYEWRSRKWNAPINVCALESRHFEGYIAYLMSERACQPRSVNRKLNALSTFFECLILKDWMTHNPMEKVMRLKVVEDERTYLTAEEVDRLLRHVDHPVVYYFLRTMAFTGMRVSECMHLKLEHLDLEQQSLLVYQGKGGKSRRIPLNDEITEDLIYYLNYVRPLVSTPYVFAFRRTGQVSRQSINNHLKRAKERAGIDKDVTSHMLRHSFASYLITKGVHVAVIQKLLGHANLRTTSTYLHVDQQELIEAIQQVDYEGVER